MQCGAQAIAVPGPLFLDQSFDRDRLRDSRTQQLQPTGSFLQFPLREEAELRRTPPLVRCDCCPPCAALCLLLHTDPAFDGAVPPSGACLEHTDGQRGGGGALYLLLGSKAQSSILARLSAAACGLLDQCCGCVASRLSCMLNSCRGAAKMWVYAGVMPSACAVALPHSACDPPAVVQLLSSLQRSCCHCCWPGGTQGLN